MAGFEPTYEGIQEIILRDQYFLTCDKSLQIFLKEKGKLSLKEIYEMTKVSNDYLEAHGYPAENHERKINGVNNKAAHKSNNGQTNTSPPPVTAPTQCGNCGMRNHNTNECRKPRAGHGNRACKLLKFVSMVSMFLTISGGKQNNCCNGA